MKLQAINGLFKRSEFQRCDCEPHPGEWNNPGQRCEARETQVPGLSESSPSKFQLFPHKPGFSFKTRQLKQDEEQEKLPRATTQIWQVDLKRENHLQSIEIFITLSQSENSQEMIPCYFHMKEIKSYRDRSLSEAPGKPRKMFEGSGIHPHRTCNS